MSKRRRRKGTHQKPAKRCHCLGTCAHHWMMRVFANGQRQWLDLNELFPDDPVEVAAAKAKDLAKKGLVVNGQRVGTPQTDTRLTLRDVVDRYMKARSAPRHYYLEGLCELTVPAANGSTVKLGAKPIDDVTTNDIDDHAVTQWRARKRTQAGAKGGVVAQRHLLQSARHLFNWAKRKGLATRTPFRDMQGTTLITVRGSTARKRRLEDGEETRILDVADPYVTDFFVAMLETGCRPGELRTLQWSEVRGDHFVVLAAKAKDREDRDVPIEPVLRTILDRRRLAPDGSSLPATAYVFGNETGELMTRRRLCGLWLDTCERAKVTNLHLHDLRREFASQLSESNVPIHEVRDALGHANISMTSTYLGISKTAKSRAYRKRTAHRARQRMKVV